MPDTMNFGQNYSLDLLMPDLIERAVESDPLLQLAPPKGIEFAKVVFDIMDNGYGVTPLRGIEGEPETQTAPGYSQKSVSPGYYGGTVVQGEKEMTEGREYGTPNEPIDVARRAALVIKNQTEGALYRMRFTLSAFFRTGTYLNSNTAKSVSHGDTLEGYASRNVFSPDYGFAADPVNADPIGFFLDVKRQLQTGTGSRFDEKSTLLCRDRTLNDLFNTNQIREKFKIAYGNTPIGLKGVNDILNGFNLPSLVEYNEGRYPTKEAAKNKDRSLFEFVIPHKSFVWGGYREDKAQAAYYALTRNMVQNPPVKGISNNPDYSFSNPDARQQWAEKVYTLVEWRQMPPQLRCTVGFNGGPAVPYPSAFGGISYD